MITIIDDLNVPAIGLKSLDNIFSKGAVGVTIDGDVIVVINGNQVAELQMARKRSSLTGNTLHHTTITQECICIIVDQLESRLVEFGGSVVLGNGKTHGIRKTLAKRASCNFNSIGIVSFRVTWGDAVYRLGEQNV
jgi:hypothetical protein